MARFKEYDYGQTELIPVSFNEQIIPGTFEYALSWIIDNTINMAPLRARYSNDETGAPAFDPKILLKIILFAYSLGIVSSRRIEHACRTNIIFKALSANAVPDYSTIALFVSGMKEEIRAVFTNVLLVCSHMELLSGNMFAVDGCKMPSNASKEWSGKHRDLKKKKDKLEELADVILKEHKASDKTGDRDERAAVRKKIDRLRMKADKIGKFLEGNKQKIGKRGLENTSNVTDNESAKMKTSRGVVQGYNGLACVDEKHQIVVAAEAFGTGPEVECLKPVVELAERNIRAVSGHAKTRPFAGKVLLADTNYFCEDNLAYLSRKKIDAVIPDQQFRKRDPRFKDRDRFSGSKGKFTQSDFMYDSKTDSYACPNGKKLTFRFYTRLGNTSGAQYKTSIKDCDGCSLRERCLKNPKKRNSRTLYILDQRNGTNHSKAMRDRIDRLEYRKLYSRRMAIVEPVFAHIRHWKGMNRFTLRAREKVNIQWLLYCIVHNIWKISRFGKVPV